jgi:hypothetical protein
MKVSENAMSSDEFREMFIRVTNSIILWGCGVSKDTEACIKRRIKEALAFRQEQYENAESVEEKQRIKKAIRNLKALISGGFAWRAALNHWIDSDPIYRERLGHPDDIKEPKFYKK